MRGRSAALAGLVAIIALVTAAQVASLVAVRILGAQIETVTPLTALHYGVYYWSIPPVRTALIIGAGAAVLVLALVAGVALSWRSRLPALHGDARFATIAEMRRLGFFGNEGVVTARFGGQFLRFPAVRHAPPHVFVAAPTGSGKTQGVMIPNALSWPGSMVVLDIKGEIYECTAGYRGEAGQEIVLLDFCAESGASHQYDPFSYIDPNSPQLVADIRGIGDHLIKPSKPDEIWSNGARQFFVSAALYFYGRGETPTLPKIKDLVDSPGGFRNWCIAFLKTPQARGHHPECLAGFTRLATGPADTVGGMLENLHEALFPVRNERTRAVLAGNSFDFRDLLHRRVSIYVRAHPKDLSLYGSLLRLFFQQLHDQNTLVSRDGGGGRLRGLVARVIGAKPNASGAPRVAGAPSRVLLGLDEFASIGPLPAIEKGVTTMRSYGLTLLAIVQSPHQLTSLYGPDSAKTLMDNFGCAIYFTPGAQAFDVARNLSDLLGTRTQKVRNRSHRAALGAGSGGGSSVSISEQRRQLMLPQEILTMSPSSVIVRAAGQRPCKAEKILAATDPIFRARRRAAPAVPLLPSATRWRPPRGPEHDPELDELEHLGEAISVGARSPTTAPATSRHLGDWVEDCVDLGDLGPEHKWEPEDRTPGQPQTKEAPMHAVTDGDLDQLHNLSAEDFSLSLEVDLSGVGLSESESGELTDRIWRQVNRPEAERAPANTATAHPA